MDGTIREVSREQSRLREAVETVRADVSVSIVFSATIDESGQVPDEQVMKFAFDVRNHQQVDVIFSVPVFGGVERKYFIVFEYENIDAY